MTGRTFDIAVIGLGAVGAATLMHLARSGARAVGVDRFSPPHDFGSSHGETRITRRSIGEGEAYVPLVLRSHELWRSIESEAHCEIFTPCGGLVIDSSKGSSMHGVEGFAKRTIDYAKRFGIAHEVLNPKDARARFPGFRISDDELVYFEPGAGFVRPEIAVESQLRLAAKFGAELRLNERVLEIGAGAGGSVTIRTERETIEAGRCLIAVGAWMKDFVPAEMKPLFKIYRQVLHWLPVQEGAYRNPGSPIFIWCYGPVEGDKIYGFPSLDGKTIKVATESYLESPTPEAVNRTVTVDEQRQFLDEKIANRLTAVTGPAARSVTCQYTVTPDSKFLIDNHPEIPNALLASCCSGHGFKHSAALGESIAARLLGREPETDISAFGCRAIGF